MCAVTGHVLGGIPRNVLAAPELIRHPDRIRHGQAKDRPGKHPSQFIILHILHQIEELSVQHIRIRKGIQHNARNVFFIVSSQPKRLHKVLLDFRKTIPVFAHFLRRRKDGEEELAGTVLQDIRDQPDGSAAGEFLPDNILGPFYHFLQRILIFLSQDRRAGDPDKAILQQEKQVEDVFLIRFVFQFRDLFFQHSITS